MGKLPTILLLTAMLLAGQTASAQLIGPVLSPATGPDAECPPNLPGQDEILVCGRRDDGTRYRVPERLRETGPIEARHMSHGARMRDALSHSRYDGQSVGPSGHLQRAAQLNCEWLEAHQAAQGREPDCTRRARGNGEDDWQRGID